MVLVFETWLGSLNQTGCFSNTHRALGKHFSNTCERVSRVGWAFLAGFTASPKQPKPTKLFSDPLRLAQTCLGCKCPPVLSSTRLSFGQSPIEKHQNVNSSARVCDPCFCFWISLPGLFEHRLWLAVGMLFGRCDA